MSNSDSVAQNTVTSPDNAEPERPTQLLARTSSIIFVISLAVYFVLFTIYCLLRMLVMTGPMGLVVRANEIAVELAYGLAFALPLALLTWLCLHILRNAQGVRKLLTVMVVVISFIAVVILVYARDHLPDTMTVWSALQHPPVLLTKLVKTSPISALGGNVYGETAQGKIYGFFCGYSIDCVWEAVDALPPPPDPKSYWSGSCGSEGGMGSLWLEPPISGQVVDRLVTHYCGPDYTIETHFILAADGTVWSLQKWGGTIELFTICIGMPLSIIMALVGTLLTGRLARPTRRVPPLQQG